MNPEAKEDAFFVEEPFAVIRINGKGQVLLREIAKFIAAIDRIHRRFQALDTLFILLRQGYTLPERYNYNSKTLASIIRRAERDLTIPRLKAAEFHSPGFWEIIGSLSPLKFISDILQQSHDRKKDNRYRNAAEATNLWLDNELKANEVIKQRIEILKKAGVSDDELRKHFFKPILSSAITLIRVSQSGAIDPHNVQLKQQEPDETDNSQAPPSPSTHRSTFPQ
ncbi:MAG: hypothetical protein D3914_05800 [Candidatus Electrothrix sp. LOE2]|nr:hypothetical protein [Candidatus Electrothrix sp. LOE2]